MYTLYSFLIIDEHFITVFTELVEVTGDWELGRIALVLGVWIVVGLLWCLRSFRWRNRADG